MQVQISRLSAQRPHGATVQESTHIFPSGTGALRAADAKNQDDTQLSSLREDSKQPKATCVFLIKISFLAADIRSINPSTHGYDNATPHPVCRRAACFGCAHGKGKDHSRILSAHAECARSGL